MIVETARLRLRPLAPDDAAAIVAGDRLGRPWSPGFPRADDMDAARLLHAAAVAPGELDVTYGPWLLSVRSSGLVVGTAGFLGPPDEDGTVEIGYGLAPEARGRGLATEAVAGLLTLAHADPRVRLVRAATDLDNSASGRVLEKSGFRWVRSDSQHHYELAWRRGR